ncbi:siderophore-interacting protein [Microbacterium sp. No. 7]|uniref:siderophore-interacting protein n=1 Tax=Microbacterium sp. No. 7 TaxID=1714373 RepID=UPI0006D0FBBC|nr:siderophore-interacting protein [Microbacterium sp. No. 7]ALJ21543.1 FAD-binding 9 siderophore-interacting domain-containing protein [Microbacterium sp. No. 7]
MTFTLERQALELRFRSVHLAARQWLTPDYVRVRLEGADLRGFDSPGSDDHIRIFFPDAPPASVEELRAAPSREYTPLAWDAEDGWLDLEFAVHGADGVAAPWGATAELGAIAGIGGPRGSMVLNGRPDGWLLAGDETAVPAMRRFAHLMDAGAVGRVLVEVTDAAHELPIDTPPGVVVEQVHRGDAAPGTALAARLDALGADDRPAGAVFGFVAAEQAIVKTGRALLLDRWGLDADHIVVKGYWKSGETEYHAPH